MQEMCQFYNSLAVFPENRLCILSSVIYGDYNLNDLKTKFYVNKESVSRLYSLRLWCKIHRRFTAGKPLMRYLGDYLKTRNPLNSSWVCWERRRPGGNGCGGCRYSLAGETPAFPGDSVCQ